MARSANVKNGERRVFRLGYVQSNDFPFLSDCFFRSFPAAKDCIKPGISGEAWTDIARELNWTLRFVKANDYGGYDPEKNGYFSGVLGMVQNGTVDGSIAFASLRPSRDKYFTFTEAPQTYENGLIIGEEIAIKPDIILYVFHWLVIGMLGVCALCIASYNYCANKIRPHGPQSRPISAVDAAWKATMTALLQDKQARPSPMNVVLGLAFTAIYLMYFAGFRSQTMIVTQRRSDLLFQRFFARKDAKVIVRSYSALRPEHRMAIFGEDLPDSDPRILVESDRGKIAQILCQDHNVAHYSRLDVFLATERVPGCVFKTLALSGNVTAIGFKGTQAYVLQKNISKPVIEKINEIIRKVYSIEQVNTYLYRKYGIKEEQALTTSAAKKRTQISLHQVQWGFLLLIGSLIAAITICIAERVILSCQRWHTDRQPRTIYLLPNVAAIRRASAICFGARKGLNPFSTIK